MSDDDVILFGYSGQKSITIRCPKCDTVVRNFRCKLGIIDCTDWDTCPACNHQFGWRIRETIKVQRPFTDEEIQKIISDKRREGK